MPELHSRLHSMHDALGRVTKGNPQHSQLGAEGNILALKGLWSTASFWRTIGDSCRLTRIFERIVSQGSRPCELLAYFMRTAKYTSVRSDQITGLSATDLDEP